AFVGGNPVGNIDLSGNVGTNVEVYCAGTWSEPKKIVPSDLYEELNNKNSGWEKTAKGPMTVYTRGDRKVITTTGPGTSGGILQKLFGGAFGGGADGMEKMETAIAKELKATPNVKSLKAQGWSRGAVIANNSVARYQEDGGNTKNTELRLWEPVSGLASGRSLKSVTGQVHVAVAIDESFFGFPPEFAKSWTSTTFFKGVHGSGASGDNIQALGGSDIQYIEDAMNAGEYKKVSMDFIKDLLPAEDDLKKAARSASSMNDFSNQTGTPSRVFRTDAIKIKFKAEPGPSNVGNKPAGGVRTSGQKPETPAPPKRDYSTAGGAFDATSGSSNWDY
ncbi:MAG: hypothetical protein AAGF54_20420, partial [Pseudomonadota bacterium]